MDRVTSAIPQWVKSPLGRLKRSASDTYSRFGSGRLCPVCNKSSRRFRAAGHYLRAEAKCVHCGALERHRLFWVYVTAQTDLFDGRSKRVLHVAPEACLGPRLAERLGEGYLSADLSSERAMVEMDVMDIKYPDEYFDVIYCSHVLEHVADDRQAMRELRRVLRSDGWAILLVPIMGESTFEDPSIVDPSERTKAYGRWNHLRLYGPDYADRLREEGFRVRVSEVSDIADDTDAVRMGLTPASGEIFYCTKA